MRRTTLQFNRVVVAASLLILLLLAAHLVVQQSCPTDLDSEVLIDDDGSILRSPGRRRIVYPEDETTDGSKRPAWWLGRSKKRGKGMRKDVVDKEEEVGDAESVGEDGLVTDWDEDVSEGVVGRVKVGREGGGSGKEVGGETVLGEGPNPLYDSLAVAVKTGGEVALKRMPIQLVTFLGPIRNLLIVGSEPDVTVGKFEVVDVYSDLYKPPAAAAAAAAAAAQKDVGPPGVMNEGVDPEDAKKALDALAVQKAFEAANKIAEDFAAAQRGKDDTKRGGKDVAEDVSKENHRLIDPLAGGDVGVGDMDDSEKHDDDSPPPKNPPPAAAAIALNNDSPQDPRLIPLDSPEDDADPIPVAIADSPPKPRLVPRDSPEEDADLVPDNESRGWKLDAHKNLPAFRLLHNRYPKADWYIMIDDDTYLFVENVHAMLSKMDPSHPWYLGAANAGDVRTALCLRDKNIYVTNTPGFW
ncbi:hypothetical protein HDU67_003539 [Dinochytrium kinnereticum]|nr:hypothetical protein HDU67_003539 [Dinochytrium kinnereticum]